MFSINILCFMSNFKGDTLYQFILSRGIDLFISPDNLMGGYNITGHRHWAAEVTKVRGGAAKDPTGDHCSDTILYPLRDRQPMQCITHVGSDGTKLGPPPPPPDTAAQNAPYRVLDADWPH